jgi:hypothetical protein
MIDMENDIGVVAHLTGLTKCPCQNSILISWVLKGGVAHYQSSTRCALRRHNIDPLKYDL